MSSNGTAPPTSNPTALGVSFSKLGDRDYGEASSRSSRSTRESTRDSRDGRDEGEGEDRWSRLSPERLVTPEHQRRNDTSHRKRTSGGFLLDSAIGNGSPRGASELPHRNGKRKAHNGFLHVDKRRNPASRVSVDSSVGGSPLSRQMSPDEPERGIDGDERRSTSGRPSMDPAQLVQMALELSESRRRHVSGPLQLPSPARSDTRRTSGLRPADTIRQASRQRQRASYASNEPPRRPSARYSFGTAQDGHQDEVRDTTEEGSALDDLPRNITPATLSRAERARKYFELASEHRRLLQHLPPLKPDADAPGNHTFVAMNSPGSAHPQINRVPSYLNNKHTLGRAYNPLQSLRNRRLRNRERQALPAPPETWQDTERIRSWIDEVEAATEGDEYRAITDRVELPTYVGEDGGATDTREVGKGHRRNDTASSVIMRPENGWSIEPSELLADAYWTERGHHKDMLENRHGSPIFRRLAPRRSTDRPRRSKDTARTSNDLQRVIDEADEVPFHKRAHRGPNILPRRHGKLPRSGSTSSASTAGGRPHAQRGYSLEEYENTGPLEKHMEQLIAQYEREGPASPELLSPDHWDSKNTPFPADGQRVTAVDGQRARRDTRSQGNGTDSGNGNGRLSVDTARHHRRAKSADGRVDSIDYSEPDSPAVSNFRSSLEVDRSAGSHHQGAFARQRSKLHKVPFFRAHSKERNGTDRTDFADTTERPTAIADYNAEARPRASQESARPSFIQRHRTTESIGSSVHRQGTGLSTGSVKEGGGSTVGRLLKGGRIGELVRGETRFGDRFRGKEPKPDDVAAETASEATESEDEGDLARKSFGDDDPSPGTSIDQTRSKPKYFLPNLPSFRSPMARNNTGTPSTADSDPIARQQRAQKEAGRSLRFDRLAPPRINLPAEEDDAYKSDTYVGEERRKSYGFLGANGSQVSVGGEPRGVSRLKSSHGQRHWSISDKLHPEPEQLSKVSPRDVARVRALLLSSGVKAREIQRRANSPSERPVALYAKISETVGKDWPCVPKKTEHAVGSRMLSEHLDARLDELEKALDGFQSGPAKRLDSRVDALGRKAADQLTTIVHDASDDADAFIVELTTKAPQDVKRVDDAIDEILRERRRQFRLLRQVSFKLLEWLVLGIMWWVWFVVVLINMGRRLVAGLLRFLRWVLVF